MSKQEKEPLFSAKNMKLLTAPFGQNNPITVQILGICSALAVTAKLKPAFVMALSVIVVTGFSSMIISLIRKGIPNRIDRWLLYEGFNIGIQLFAIMKTDIVGWLRGMTRMEIW